MCNLEQEYWVLQRRTVLYGIVALLLAVLCAVSIVQISGMLVWQAGILGGALGITFQLISWIIAMALTRARRQEGNK